MAPAQEPPTLRVVPHIRYNGTSECAYARRAHHDYNVSDRSLVFAAAKVALRKSIFSVRKAGPPFEVHGCEHCISRSCQRMASVMREVRMSARRVHV